MAFEWSMLSAKQLDAIENANARVNILHGSVRSGKTIASLVAWMYFLGKSPHEEFLMTGKTRDSLYRNVLHPWFKMLEGIPYEYHEIKGELKIFGKLIWLVGLKDEGVNDKIKGMTIGGAYIDEGTGVAQSTFNIVVERCSLTGAQIILTTNPGSPYHYLHEDYITNEEALASGRVKVWHFVLDDNLSLDEDYKRDLKANHKGVFYQRNVLGRWVIAEGAIYDVYNENVHDFDDLITPDYIKRNFDEVRVGVDYGSASVTVFVMIGIRTETNGKHKEKHFSVIKEYYHDVGAEGIQPTDGRYAQAMKEFVHNIPYHVVNVPHDATNLRMEFEKVGLKCAMVKHDVVETIQFIRNLFAENRMMIHEGCRNVKTGLAVYVWDPKTVGSTNEKPLKKDDHAVDAMRYAVNEVEDKKPIVASVGYW